MELKWFYAKQIVNLLLARDIVCLAALLGRIAKEIKNGFE